MSVNTREERIELTAIDRTAAGVQSAQRGFQQLGVSVDTVKNALGALGIAVGAGAMVKLYTDIIKATAALDDMAEMTGVSVENLSKLQTYARIGGHDFEGLSSQIGKMIKGLKASDEDGQKAAKALEHIGIQAKTATGAWRDMGEVTIELAKKLHQYEDGAGKVALVQDALGKGAERYLPLLKDIAEEGEVQARVTAQQAAEAEKLEKSWNRIKLQMEDFSRSTALGMVGALQSITDNLVTANEKGNLFWQTLVEIAKTGAVLAAVFPKWTEIGSQGDKLAERIFAWDERQRQMRTGPNVWPGAAKPSGPGTPGALGALNWTTPGKSSGEDPFKSLLSNLENELVKTQGQTRAEEVLLQLQQKRYAHVSAAQREAAVGLATQLDLLKQEEDQRKRLGAEAEAEARRFETKHNALSALAESQQEYVDQLKFENSLINETDVAIQQANAARQMEQALRQTINQLTSQGIELSSEEVAALRVQMEARQAALKPIIEEGVARKKAKDAAEAAAKEWEDEWKRTNDNISRGLTDALMRGFESGKSAAENFRDSLVNMFKTLVLEPTIRGVLQPVAQGMTGAAMSMFGGSANASSGSGMNLLSNGSSLYNLLGGGSNLVNSVAGGNSIFSGGAAALANIGGGTMLAGAGAGTALAGEAAALGAAQIAGGAGMGAMAAIPYVGWAIAAAMLISSLMEDDGPAQRGLLYSANLGSTDRSSDGYAGYPWQTKWGSADMGPAQEAFATAMAEQERSIIGRLNLTPDKIDQVNAALAGPNQTWVNAGEEWTPVESSGAFQQIAAARLQAIASVVGESVEELTETLSTSDKDWAIAMASLRESLASGLDPLGYWTSKVQALRSELGVVASGNMLDEWRSQFLGVMDNLSPDQIDRWQELGKAIDLMGQARDEQMRIEKAAADQAARLAEEQQRAAQDAAEAAAEAAEAAADAAEALRRAAEDRAQTILTLQSSAESQEGSLRQALRGLPGQLGITSLEDFQRSLATSDSLSPLDRLAGARSAYADTLSRARGGDLSSVLSFGARGQDLLSIGRDVFASGGGFQSIYADLRATTAEMIQRQNELQMDIVSSVPIAIRDTSNDQIAELRKGFTAMVGQLEDVKAELRRIEATA